MVIQKLNAALIEKIRGSFTINTLTQCAAELILNSLDANSTAIAVRLNLVTLRVQVIDNGDGIGKDSMDLLGRRFYTSKCSDPKDLERNLKTHGYRGEALANIAECSKSVTITSRRRNAPDTYVKTLEKGVGDEARPTRRRASAGTTVTVEGFFHCFPVRKRRIVAEVVLGDVKRYLECLLLVHPKVSFTLKNDVTNELVLDSPKQDNVVSRFRHLHPGVLDDDFALLKVAKGATAVEGLLCKELSKHKNLQYLYVNKRPVHSAKTIKFISGLFLSRKQRQRENKHPVFVVNVKCPYAEVDLMLNSTETTVHFKRGNLVTRCLEKLVCTLFGEKTQRKPEGKTTPEARPPSECSISKIRGAVKVKGFKRETGGNVGPSHSKDDRDVGEAAPEELESVPLTAENPHDEKGGKGLIMDMFLKSTRVFNSEESAETVFEEEADLCVEKSVTDRKKTTSVCMNVKSRRKLKKKYVKLQSTAVQTSFQVKETKIPDGDFTIVINDDKVNFVPKDPMQDQPVPISDYRKPEKNCNVFDLFTLLPSPPRHHSHPGLDTRYEHFQPPYQTNYPSGCNRNCCLQRTNPYYASNFYNPGCGRENCPNMAFAAPNMVYEYEKSRNAAHYFKPPHAEPFRFANCRNLGCRHESDHNVGRNFAAPQPGPANFLNYHNLVCGHDDDCVTQKVNHGRSNSHKYCDLLGHRYDNNHDLAHRYVTQNVPQADSSSRNAHHYNNYAKLQNNPPNFNNRLEFGGSHDKVDDLLETDKKLCSPKRKRQSSKAFREVKPDFPYARKYREDVPDFCFNYQSTHQTDQVEDDEFNTNFLTAHRDHTEPEFNPDNHADNITEFTVNYLTARKDQEGVSELQDGAEINPDFMNAEKDDHNITEFTAKFLSTHKGQEDVAGFATNDFSELLEVNQRNPFQDATQTDNQERCTLTFKIQDTNDKSEGVGRPKQLKLSKDWVRKRKHRHGNFLGQYEN